MYDTLKPTLQKELTEIKDGGLYKTERIISTSQGAEITANGKPVLNFCANNYLGLSSHPKVIEAQMFCINNSYSKLNGDTGFGHVLFRFR